ncbi:hypothetical protein PAPYR_2741 [Paratrimastix pyriformis]|uniref:Uncharacterized protein n=1 Tax=Paratrimastix pyriformis TaxID=342808 RepID=A0ABQ8UP01_9EUKA|nr:hypothetical protein PAPYR_2741 [Paratrimastix pyriformis]
MSLELGAVFATPPSQVLSCSTKMRVLPLLFFASLALAAENCLTFFTCADCAAVNSCVWCEEMKISLGGIVNITAPGCLPGGMFGGTDTPVGPAVLSCSFTAYKWMTCTALTSNIIFIIGGAIAFTIVCMFFCCCCCCCCRRRRASPLADLSYTIQAPPEGSYAIMSSDVLRYCASILRCGKGKPLLDWIDALSDQLVVEKVESSLLARGLLSRHLHRHHSQIGFYQDRRPDYPPRECLHLTPEGETVQRGLVEAIRQVLIQGRSPLDQEGALNALVGLPLPAGYEPPPDLSPSPSSSRPNPKGRQGSHPVPAVAETGPKPHESSLSESWLAILFRVLAACGGLESFFTATELRLYRPRLHFVLTQAGAFPPAAEPSDPPPPGG